MKKTQVLVSIKKGEGNFANQHDMMPRIMEVDPHYFAAQKQKAENTYAQQASTRCPYFNADVILNSDGFHHLQFSARRERNKREQLLKFSLLPLALQVLHKSGTVQEYRKMLAPIGKKRSDGFVPMKTVEYWGFAAIVGENKSIRIRVITRRVGDGNIIFWSVMPDTKIKDGKQKLFARDIEDEG